MELAIIGPDCERKAHEGSISQHHCVIACNDLPDFCDFLLEQDKSGDQFLNRCVLSIKIRDLLNETAYEEGQIGRTMTRTGMQKLLDPLHHLHSIHTVNIEGSISVQDQTALREILCRSSRDCEAPFDKVVAAFKDASATFTDLDASLAIYKLTNTLDVMKTFTRQTSTDFVHAPILTGIYAGPTYGETIYTMQYAVWIYLAKANIMLKNYKDAHHWTNLIIHFCIDYNENLGESPVGGYPHALVYYMEAQFHEQDLVTVAGAEGYGLGFEKMVELLREVQQHDPDYSKAVEKLRRWEEEVEKKISIRALANRTDGVDHSNNSSDRGSGDDVSDKTN